MSRQHKREPKTSMASIAQVPKFVEDIVLSGKEEAYNEVVVGLVPTHQLGKELQTMTIENIDAFVANTLGGNVDAHTPCSQALSTWFAQNNRWEVVRHLVEKHGANVNYCPYAHGSLLELAVQCGTKDDFCFLIHHGANPLRRSKAHIGTLGLAARLGRKDILTVLSSLGICFSDQVIVTEGGGGFVNMFTQHRTNLLNYAKDEDVREFMTQLDAQLLEK